MMSALTAEVMAVLGKDASAARSSELAGLVDSRIVPVFDFERMTRIALARNWRLASTEQQLELTAQFKTLLVRTYSQALLEFRGLAIDYKPLRAAAGETEVTVRSAMRRPGVEALTIDYEMADGIGGWRVYDVKIAGVSLVLTYRESFAAAVRARGARGQEPAERSRRERGRSGQARPGAPDLRRLALVPAVDRLCVASARCRAIAAWDAVPPRPLEEGGGHQAMKAWWASRSSWAGRPRRAGPALRLPACRRDLRRGASAST